MASRNHYARALICGASLLILPREAEGASEEEKAQRVVVSLQTCDVAEFEPALAALKLEFSLLGLEVADTGDVRLEIRAECAIEKPGYSAMHLSAIRLGLELETHIAIPSRRYKTLALTASDFVRTGLEGRRRLKPLVGKWVAPVLQELEAEFHFSLISRSHWSGRDTRLGMVAAYSSLRPDWVGTLGLEGTVAAVGSEERRVFSMQISGVASIANRLRLGVLEGQLGPRAELGWGQAFSLPIMGFEGARRNAMVSALGLETLWIWRARRTGNWHVGAQISYVVTGLNEPTLVDQRGWVWGARLGGTF